MYKIYIEYQLVSGTFRTENAVVKDENGTTTGKTHNGNINANIFINWWE